MDILHKFTCIELKAQLATENDLSQTLRYENWLIRKLAHGDAEMVQSFLVASSFAPTVVDYVVSRRRIEERGVRLLSYRINVEHQDVLLEEIGG